MSALKDQDPDYGPSVANNEKHQRIYEENARSNTAKKITAIIEREFSQEINAKEKEVLEIQERLHRASKALHLLRYVIVADFYNRKQCQNSQSGETKQTQIHPAIKQLIGKSPKICNSSLVSTSATTSNNEHYFSISQIFSKPLLNTIDCTALKSEKLEEKASEIYRLEKRSNETDEEPRPKKIPRYIPPKSGIPEPPCPSRGVRHKVRKRIIIGNISKWIPPEWREDAASHKWTIYRPNDVVEVTAPPFCLSRRGWGEFPLRVQLHFKSALNKPMDIIHHLKLDRTYTGLQTLGSETLVDVWIYADPRNSKRNIDKSIVQSFNETKSQMKMNSDDSGKIKIENDEHFNSTFHFTNSETELMGSTNNNFDVNIKQESPQNSEFDENLINIEQVRFYIDLDHDYCGSKYSSSFKENLTIDHSSSPSELIDLSIKEVSKETKQEKDKEAVIQNNILTVIEPSMNRDLSSIKINEDTNSVAPSLSNELNIKKTKALPLSCTKIQSNLRPLEISIPPLFESSNKHVLVLQNKKTISIDIAMPRNDDHTRKFNNNPTKSKINLTASRGISLLKKSSGSNLNGTEVQQGKLQLSRSVLLNINSNIPALKIAERRNLQNDHLFNLQKELDSEEYALKINNLEEPKELKLQSRQKITLGKDKHKFQNRKEFYDDVFRAIETAKVSNIQGLLRFIVRRMPMVTGDASDSDYRQLHPYACASEEEFFEYSVAKRNACEWGRARMVQCLLKKKLFLEEELWTVKEIMIWARLHGYVPFCSNFGIQSIKQQKNLFDSSIIKSISTCTEPDSFCKWLQICPDRSNDQLFHFNLQQSNDLDSDIDIVNDEIPLKNKKKDVKKNRVNKRFLNTKIMVLEMEEKLAPLHDFVCETAQEIGVKLTSEEIQPNVIDCAASRMIMRSVECLIDDLVRMSLAKAWERCSDNGYPKIIVLDDVRGALLNREEFDIFTNQGLGSKYRLTTMD
ncbi:YEATS domain containing 2 homolog D12 isoform X2 [Ptiloglossa arizonensis]|uniref:YEATS domain containing 2 homolog D12 isoform X2 n=1 Tax=Ptiloglossa arizonensis TaxID=3350558 RepID=UPI003FA151A6